MSCVPASENDPKVSCLSYSNLSGDGVAGLAPLIHVEPVSKLW